MASHRAPKVTGRATAAAAVVGVTAGTVALMPGTSQASPTQSLSQAKAEVATLNQQAEVAGQQYDAAPEQYLSQAGMQDQQAQQEAMLLKSIVQYKAQLAQDKKAATEALAEEQQVR